MNSIRKNAICGIIEEKGIIPISLHFSEWWNGEGLDFEFNDEKRIHLHSEEIQALLVAALLTGMVDIEDAKSRAHQIEKDHREKERRLELMRNGYY